MTTSVAYGFDKKHASTRITPGSARSSSPTLGEWVPDCAFSRRSASRTVRSSGACGPAVTGALAGALQLGYERQCLAPGARHILHWQRHVGTGICGPPSAICDGPEATAAASRNRYEGDGS